MLQVGGEYVVVKPTVYCMNLTNDEAYLVKHTI